jgi:flagellar basal body-associated protein FliL
MSDSPETPPAEDEAPAGVPKKGGGAVAMILGILLPALAAGGAGFGGAKMGSGHAAEAAPAAVDSAKPPGGVISMTPFVVSLPGEGSGPRHTLKVSIAVEIEKGVEEKEFAKFEPRMRDATITRLRALTFDEAANAATQEKLRDELLERYHEMGAHEAQKIWFTEFVMQ